jgi:hypothetical protein
MFTFISLPALAAMTYEFYHVALRDYNGDGSSNGDDHVRYGFTMQNENGSWADLSGWKARAYDGDNSEIETKDIEGGTAYQSASNSQTYSESNYWRARFGSNGIKTIELDDGQGNIYATHQVNLPDTTQPFNSYNGFDVNSVSWQRQTNGWLFSWDDILDPSTDPSSYRFSLNDPDWSYEILFTLDVSQTEQFLSDDLLGVSDTWRLQFQQRFANPDQNAANSNWLRSYGMIRDISLSESPIATPIPGSIWLLGGGLIGLINFRRRLKK